MHKSRHLSPSFPILPSLALSNTLTCDMRSTKIKYDSAVDGERILIEETTYDFQAPSSALVRALVDDATGYLMDQFRNRFHDKEYSVSKDVRDFLLETFEAQTVDWPYKTGDTVNTVEAEHTITLKSTNGGPAAGHFIVGFDVKAGGELVKVGAIITTRATSI